VTKTFNPDRDVKPYHGRYFAYDILKEGAIALVVVAALTMTLAIAFGSPDDKFATLKGWANAAPVDFATTAFTELDGSSGVATYGAPYNTASPGQTIGPLALQRWVGVHIPVNAAQDFVIDPLRAYPNQPGLAAALQQWTTASSTQQTAWATAYGTVASSMTFQNGHVTVGAAADGPVPVLIDDLTQMARTGALDQALVTRNGFYTTDYTKPLLFLADGNWFAGLADKQHLSGSQWGMMNETGSYPGQAWLWLYTFWYQIPPFSSSDNADALVWALMMVLTVLLLLVPFIPGLRTIPRKVKIYRLIWREYYRQG
jgi:hypothetical protein